MGRLVFIFLAAFLALSSASFVQPRNLVDEAKEQLEQLKSIVQGNIMAAHDSLDNAVSEFKTHELNVRNDASLAIDQQQQSIYTLADTAINLVEADGHDISACYNIRENILTQLPDRFMEKITACTQKIDTQASQTVQDSRYVVDITMNRVHDYENQLTRCADDLLCVSPVLTEIELSKIRKPREIKAEVQATEGFLTSLTVSINTCGESNIAAHTTETYVVLKDLERCIYLVINKPRGRLS